MQPRTIVYYHGAGWDAPKSRQQQISKSLSKYARVIYLDGGGDRLRIRVRRIEDNLIVVSGFVRILDALERRGLEFMCRILCQIFVAFMIKRPLVFWLAENYMRPSRFFRCDGLVFDCMDPCFSPHTDAEYYKREKEVVRQADLVFASAAALAEDCSQHASRDSVHLLSNACAPEDYTSESLDGAAQPGWWHESTNPIAAFIGGLDWRFDFDSMLHVVKQNPNIHFVFAGPVRSELQEKARQLANLANATLPGLISLEEGRYLLKRCSVALIPFTSGYINDRINPVKMYMYALLGKPAVSMETAELTRYPEVVSTARNADEFSAQLLKAIERSKDPEEVRKLKSFAMSNTWEHRAQFAWEKLLALETQRSEARSLSTINR